ncbi:MAG: hypothetical protein N4A35_16650 [Flavobacteriales bacterium]|jgi:hypothetical protein|nr:hypothetical protein [Flavobacteriales bacterium]
MKHYFLPLFFLVIGSTLTGQETILAKFTNGEEKEIQYFDDPYRLPKFEVGFSPFTITSMPRVVFGYKIEPRFRVNEILSFDGHFISDYTDDMNEMSGRYDFSTKTYDFSLMGHYTFANKISKENKMIPVGYDYASSGDYESGNVIYKIELPVIKNTAYRVDGGFGKLATNALYSERDTLSNYYVGGPILASSLQVGASIFKSRSYQVISDGERFSYFRTTTFYTYLTYALANKYNIYRQDEIKQPDGETAYTYTDVTSNISDLKETRVGFRIGVSHSIGMRNTGIAATVGLVAGITPTFTSSGFGYNANKTMDHKSGSSNTSGATYFGFNVGLSFGDSPWRK